MTSKSVVIKFDQAIDKYYKLKHKYDASIQSAVNKIRTNELLTTEEKQLKFSELKKRCISCGKSGGTIFKQEGNLLTAKCGHEDKPCKLDIQIQRAKYKSVSYNITKLSKEVNDKKTDIIRTKLNFLFGFSNEQETISVFNKLKTELVAEVKNYQLISEYYINNVENLSNKDEIAKQNSVLFSLIQSFKDLINQYDQTGENQYLKDAGKLYVDEIAKTAQELQKLKYSIQYIYSSPDNIHHLVQETYKPSEMQVAVPGIENKILAFIL